MHVPPGPQVAEEAPLLRRRQALPDLLGVGPQGIDDGAPGIHVVAGAAHGLPDRLQHRDDRRAVDLRQRQRRLRRRLAVPARQQAAAGDRVDRPGVVPVEQGDHRIDHGQPGADQQHRRLRIEPGEGLRRPRIGVVMGGRVVVREVAGREHGNVDLVGAAAAHLHAQAVGPLPERHRLVRHQEEVAAVAGLPDLVAEQILDVGAVEPARHELVGAAPVGLGGALRLGVVAQPVREMVGLVGERAHAAGADVEEVIGIARRVGQPAAELGVLLDEVDAAARQEAPQQLHRQQRAAEPRSYDRNARTGCSRHCILPAVEVNWRTRRSNCGIDVGRARAGKRHLLRLVRAARIGGAYASDATLEPQSRKSMAPLKFCCG